MAGTGSTPELERLRARLDSQAAEDDDLGGRVTVAESAAQTALTTAQAAAAQAEANRGDIIVYSGRIGRPAWSVDRFGAVAGDQDTDTGAAIEAACAAHGAFYLPQGDWYCETEAELPSNTKGHADGWDARLLWRDNAPLVGGLASTGSVRLLKGQNTDGGNSDHLSGIQIEGMWLDGNGDNQQNETGAIAAVTLHGDYHTVQGCRFTGFRPGESKEVFWVNLSGTTGSPALRPRVLDNVFSDNAGQSLAGSTECSLILVAGYPVDGTASAITIGGEVSGNAFHDLLENGTTHNRTVHAVALMGEDGLFTRNRMWDVTGDCSLAHYNSGSVNRQTVALNYYDGEYRAVALFRGLVGSYDPDYTYLSFYNNHFVSSSTCCNLVHYSDGTGVMENVTFQGNTIQSTGTGTAAIAVENRLDAQFDALRVVNNVLDGESGSTPVETGLHVLYLTSDIGSVAAVPAAQADKLLCGDNMTETAGRATMRAYLDSSATAITWTTNSNWGATDL